MSDVVVIDGSSDFDDVLPDELWEFMRERYWVCTQRGETARFDSWIFYRSEPMPVPNDTMHWRRPTWGEALAFVRLPIIRPDLVEKAREATKEHGRRYGRRWVMRSGVLGVARPVAA